MASFEEQQYHYALQAERAAKEGDSEVSNLKSGIHPPAKLKYIIAFTIAIIADLLDIVAAILILAYGAGIPLGWIADIILDIPLILLGFSSNKDLKKKTQASNAIAGKIATMRQKIQQYRDLYAVTLRTSRKIKSLRKPAARLAKKFKGLRKVATRSIIGKTIFRIGMDLIPIVDLWPWRTLGIRSSYQEEKQAYEEFLLMLQDHGETREEEVEATNDYLSLELEEYESEQQEDAA